MSNGHYTSTLLDKLELRVRSLRLQPKDLIVVQFSSMPSINEMVDFQSSVKHLLEHLELDFPVFFMVLPSGIEMTQVDEAAMEKLGWYRRDEAKGDVSKSDNG